MSGLPRLRSSIADVMNSARPPLHRGSIDTAMAWVVTHRTAAGIDGVLPARFRNPKKRANECRIIFETLRDGTYRFHRAREGRLKRRGKRPRTHAIATLRDAVVLRAISIELRTVWDQLPACIVGHRPGTNHRKVVAAISRFLLAGSGWILRFDLKGAFAEASFGRAIEILATLTDRHDLIKLIVNWRKAVGPKFKGLVEGASIAPLLLAVLLGVAVIPHLEHLGGLLVIWADDGWFGLATREQVDEAQRVLDQRLVEVGLKCHPQKTGIYEIDPTHTGPSPWSFIGFQYRMWKPIPSLAARTSLVDELEALAVKDEVAMMRELAWGWARHFAPGDAPDLLYDLNREVLARCGFVTKRPPDLLKISGRVALWTHRVPSRGPKGSSAVTWDSDEVRWTRPLSQVVASASAALADSTTYPHRSAAHGAGGRGRTVQEPPAPSHPGQEAQ